MISPKPQNSQLGTEVREFSPLPSELLSAVGVLRVQAWEASMEQSTGMTEWLDRFDATARHWVALEQGRPIAAARMSVHETLEELPDAESYAGLFPESLPGPIASLNRLVVHPEARRQGWSRHLDLVRLAAAEKLGCRYAILGTASGPHRVSQLVGWGFALVGYGPRFRNPPLSLLPSPAVLVCQLPRSHAKA